MLNGFCGYLVDLICCRLFKNKKMKYEDATATVLQEPHLASTTSLLPPQRQDAPGADNFNSHVNRTLSNSSDTSFHSVGDNTSNLPTNS